MPLMTAKNISKTFPLGEASINVLHDINLSIHEGELLAITGTSGSGKSTLMYILGCLDMPTSGTYLFEEKNVAELNPDQLAHIRNKKIGFVFQRFNLLPDLSALDNVILPALYAGKKSSEAQKKAEDILKLIGLGPRIHHKPYQLSGGEQQRVSIARAMINDPAVLLADEPTGNLDSKTGALIMNIFKEINQEQNVTVIIVSHDMEVAQETRRIIKLLDGTIIEDSKSPTL
jgi:putative ABC transport system ATP-binding protein